MKFGSATFFFILILLCTISCKKDAATTSTYQIDHIDKRTFDAGGNAVYEYTFYPNNKNVYDSVATSNDTLILLCKHEFGEYNFRSTVHIKNNRIFETYYNEPKGQFGQDGYISHQYQFYNTNGKIDSVVEFLHGYVTDPSPTDSSRQTYVFNYINRNLSTVTLNGFDMGFTYSYNNYANQKDLIGLDVNEFLSYYTFIFAYPIGDGSEDIGEFPKNCLIYNFNTLNYNSQNLLRSSNDGHVTYSYIFDPDNNNRIKEITEYSDSIKYKTYTFYYKN